MLEKIKRIILGKPRDPMDKDTRSHIALTAFFAWVGLGADGLSSSCYGPQEAFLALGIHSHLALYLALLTGITVFIISFAYNQVIELFPNGGGGYKVATQLLGPNMGVIAGSALIVDYVLTIVISIASGTDAFFSLLPYEAQAYKVKTEAFFILLLMILNLRGMKESIKILIPIFLGFVFTHLFMIIYGIIRHGSMLPVLVHNAVAESHHLAATEGTFFAIALFLRAYSIGSGTYTGLEAVSNNVNTLAEPRVRTGKWTMFIMAVSLSFTAAGIILLYLLWNAEPQLGQTLNAVVFRSLLHDWPMSESIITITLIFEFGLLFVGANTGFLGGPAVLSNMALDHWVPNKFRNLSNRLISQNGILLFGLAAVLLLATTKGHVDVLVILYSVNVFLAFSTSIFGLCKYWWQKRSKRPKGWFRHFTLSLIGFSICSSILFVLIGSQLGNGSLQALAITAMVVIFCYFIRRHYQHVNKKLAEADKLFMDDLPVPAKTIKSAPFDTKQPTAVFFVAKSRGAGMHTLLWVQRLFPNYFKNFIFVSVGLVDVKSYGAEETLEKMQHEVETNLSFFENFCRSRGMPVRTYSAYCTDPVAECTRIAQEIGEEIPTCIFFASQLVMETDNWFTRQLHNETAFAVQRKLHLQGKQMMILPMKLA